MAELTVEERLEKLEDVIHGESLHLIVNCETGSSHRREVEVAGCPVCGHITIQIKKYEENMCLTCGHKLASRIVAID